MHVRRKGVNWDPGANCNEKTEVMMRRNTMMGGDMLGCLMTDAGYSSPFLPVSTTHSSLSAHTKWLQYNCRMIA